MDASVRQRLLQPSERALEVSGKVTLDASSEPSSAVPAIAVPQAGDCSAERRWVHRSFGDALEWAGRTHGPREAVVCGESRLTFTQMRDRVRAFARGLIELGIEPGEKV